MDDFVKEFHQRQRIADRQPATKSSWLAALGGWFREMQMAKWAYAAGIGYACLMAWLLISPSADDTVRGDSAIPVNYPAPTPKAPLTTPEHADQEINKSKPVSAEPF